jgi:hypothetical protein
MRQYDHYRRLTESQTTDIHFLIGEEQWLKLNRNALTRLVSAFHQKATNIVPSSAKMQGQRRPKSHVTALTQPAQNEELNGID